jgi:3-oxoacyl-[acyl-carrier protein] reductase
MTDGRDPPPLGSLHDLAGKVALVTGAGNGIGRACARRLSEAGARVCALDVEPPRGPRSAVDGATPGTTLSIQGDVRSREDVERAAATVVGEWGRIDVVVNSAGLFPPSPLLDIGSELWEHVMEVNATGTFLVSQICAGHIRDTAGAGAIVNIASKSAFQPSRGFAHYAASKGAVVMITKALALELAPLLIRVNAVAPGSVATDTATRMGQAAVEQAGDEVMRRSARCPLGRSASPDEIARIALFLASDWSSYMTGSIVVADGGFLLS